MLHCDPWRADSFRFTLSGQNAQRFFGLAAAQGCPLRDIRCTADGFSAAAQGRDRAALLALADQHGWALKTVRRAGPGRIFLALLRRPGILAGLLCFLGLVRVLSGFVWAMELTLPDSRQEQPLRALLAECGIQEGAWLTQAKLLTAQQRLNQNSDWFGWLSLNFAGGCLRAESTPLDRRPVAQAAQNTALYARADALILAVSLDSGFAAVAPGQYVAAGQLLAANARLDRSGDPVFQAAAGQIMARVEETFTVTQPLSVRCQTPRGDCREAVTLFFLGHELPLQSTYTPPTGENTQIQRTPLRLGMLALPGCLCRETRWPTVEQQLDYSPDTAAALARRACRLALLAQYPDAEVEHCATTMEPVAEGMRCTARYVFRADIALSAESRGEVLS